MTTFRFSVDRAVQAISLIEEACLMVLLEDLARCDAGDGLPTDEIAARTGLSVWLGHDVSDAVVGRVLLNLSAAGRAETAASREIAARWTLTDAEASIRPTRMLNSR